MHLDRDGVGAGHQQRGRHLHRERVRDRGAGADRRARVGARRQRPGGQVRPGDLHAVHVHRDAVVGPRREEQLPDRGRVADVEGAAEVRREAAGLAAGHVDVRGDGARSPAQRRGPGGPALGAGGRRRPPGGWSGGAAEQVRPGRLLRHEGGLHRRRGRRRGRLAARRGGDGGVHARVGRGAVHRVHRDGHGVGAGAQDGDGHLERHRGRRGGRRARGRQRVGRAGDRAGGQVGAADLDAVDVRRDAVVGAGGEGDGAERAAGRDREGRAVVRRHGAASACRHVDVRGGAARAEAERRGAGAPARRGVAGLLPPGRHRDGVVEQVRPRRRRRQQRGGGRRHGRRDAGRRGRAVARAVGGPHEERVGRRRSGHRRGGAGGGGDHAVVAQDLVGDAGGARAGPRQPCVAADQRGLHAARGRRCGVGTGGEPGEPAEPLVAAGRGHPVGQRSTRPHGAIGRDRDRPHAVAVAGPHLGGEVGHVVAAGRVVGADVVDLVQLRPRDRRLARRRAVEAGGVGVVPVLAVAAGERQAVAAADGLDVAAPLGDVRLVQREGAGVVAEEVVLRAAEPDPRADLLDGLLVAGRSGRARRGRPGGRDPRGARGGAEGRAAQRLDAPRLGEVAREVHPGAVVAGVEPGDGAVELGVPAAVGRTGRDRDATRALGVGVGAATRRWVIEPPR